MGALTEIQGLIVKQISKYNQRPTKCNRKRRLTTEYGAQSTKWPNGRSLQPQRLIRHYV
ncbi:uncharacterized protein EURHEDRAFT_409114 [Aspergillus ruber CBS 135680]|uniref:Uncharacterized protein n=1 Tax=Aspergillus ruber (strain CBS 135680) TaxID=1388766 RepID=A0A017SNI7_ASPRC|nr:uncharacterized protein EURHEDRAFT_409114 [Aspergillus ruber CBS 135680]EYE97840.1 hypothetical protein EURHEDRAFT_409114 [Aspergillus ruber CBS 135680]